MHVCTYITTDAVIVVHQLSITFKCAVLKGPRKFHYDHTLLTFVIIIIIMTMIIVTITTMSNDVLMAYVGNFVD